MPRQERPDAVGVVRPRGREEEHGGEEHHPDGGPRRLGPEIEPDGERVEPGREEREGREKEEPSQQDGEHHGHRAEEEAGEEDHHCDGRRRVGPALRLLRRLGGPLRLPGCRSARHVRSFTLPLEETAPAMETGVPAAPPRLKVHTLTPGGESMARAMGAAGAARTEAGRTPGAWVPVGPNVDRPEYRADPGIGHGDSRTGEPASADGRALVGHPGLGRRRHFGGGRSGDPPLVRPRRPDDRRGRDHVPGSRGRSDRSDRVPAAPPTAGALPRSRPAAAFCGPGPTGYPKPPGLARSARGDRGADRAPSLPRTLPGRPAVRLERGPARRGGRIPGRRPRPRGIERSHHPLLRSRAQRGARRPRPDLDPGRVPPGPRRSARSVRRVGGRRTPGRGAPPVRGGGPAAGPGSAVHRDLGRRDPDGGARDGARAPPGPGSGAGSEAAPDPLGDLRPAAPTEPDSRGPPGPGTSRPAGPRGRGRSEGMCRMRSVPWRSLLAGPLLGMRPGALHELLLAVRTRAGPPSVPGLPRQIRPRLHRDLRRPGHPPYDLGPRPSPAAHLSAGIALTTFAAEMPARRASPTERTPSEAGPVPRARWTRPPAAWWAWA